jgi:hypothetical protein
MSKRLTVAGIQIYFDNEGVALFSAPGKERSAVERELTEHQEFIEQWLSASEEPIRNVSPRKMTAEERDLRRILKGTARNLKRTFNRAFVETVIREVVKARKDAERFTEAQIEESIAEAMSSL